VIVGLVIPAVLVGLLFAVSERPWTPPRDTTRESLDLRLFRKRRER
jgi:hypothetical protein